MPADWLVRTVEDRLAQEGIGPAEVVAAEIYELSPEQTTAILDEMVGGAPFPMVLVGERVVCTGGVDLEAVLEAAAAV